MKWQEPPPVEPTNQRAPEPSWLAECRKQPKRWALVMEGITRSKANYYQSLINLGQWRYVDGEKWEATYRSQTENAELKDLYVRYIGRR